MSAENTKIIGAGLITLAVIQIAVVIVIIYLGVRVGDLSSEVDDLSSDVDGLSSNVGGISSEVDTISINVEGIRDMIDRPPNTSCRANTLILDDEFEEFNLTRWKHEITLGGGGNWEFQYYDNNRSNSYVKDGVLYLNPSFLVDDIGDGALRGGYIGLTCGGHSRQPCALDHISMDVRGQVVLVETF